MHSIGIILLAAGGSSRMGRPKQLLPFGKSTLLRHAAETALATGFLPVVVVLGAEAASCARQIEDLPVAIVRNADWSLGMGGSLRLGIETLEKIAPRMEAVLVMLHDQPRISAHALQKLAALWDAERHPIAAAAYGGTTGAPAIFARAYFSELRHLAPDAGAKRVLSRYADVVTTLELPEALDDIDAPSDYQRLASSQPGAA